jgi:hypothetical protein
MPVHTEDNNFKVLAMIFEARYDEGFRFLDHAGELLVKMRKIDPSWTVALVTPTVVRLVNQEQRLTLNVGTEKIDVSTEKLSLSDADKKARPLGEATERFYHLSLDVLKLPRTLRVGSRFLFLAPSDSLEEADRFMWRSTVSPLSEAVLELTKSRATESQITYVVDDNDSGNRRRITLGSVILEQKPEDAPFLGLPGDRGSGGIVVDIDVYCRPEESHLAKASLFVQDSYLKARSQASAILTWMRGRQK